MPTYRRPELLKRAIKSVLTQTDPRFELWVYDNASGDETGAVVTEFAAQDSRVKYFCQPVNIGLWPNFNFAVKNVKTEFFSLLCDDDLVLPRFLETALAGFAAYPDAYSSSGRILFTDMDGTYATVGPTISHDGPYFSPPDGLLAWRMPVRPLLTAHLFRTTAFDHTGYFDTTMLGDFDVEIRLAAQFPIVTSPIPCAVVVNHPQSCTKLTEVNYDQWAESYDLITRKLPLVPGLAPEVAAKALANLHDDIADNITKLGLLAVSAGNFDAAFKAADTVETHYSHPKEAALVRRAASLAKALPPLHALYKAAHHLRTQRRNAKTSDLQRKLQAYMRDPSGAIEF